MSIPIISVYSDHNAVQRLKYSAETRGWEFIGVPVIWQGFGTKLIATYNYLKEHPEITSFVFCDAYDVVVLGTSLEFETKLPSGADMLVSTEKGLWPPILHPFKNDYPKKEHGFNYPNSGLYFSASKLLKELIEFFTPYHDTDDQFWLNLVWQKTKGIYKIGLDYNQSLFNSHSFVSEGEYTYHNNRVQIMGNEPIFIHFNGKTFDPEFDKNIEI